MKSLVALIVMAIWSVAIYYVMYHVIGFHNHLHDWLWSICASVMLIIGLVGNVWIYFIIVKETPWQWMQKG